MCIRYGRGGLSPVGSLWTDDDRLAISRQKNVTPFEQHYTFATRLIEDGNDLVKVQRAMGHANVQTTARYDRRGEKDQKEMAKSVRL